MLMKKNKKDKEKNTFLNVGFLSFSFWFYIFLVYNLYHNYFLILTPVLLQLIYIYIILICVNNNIKIKGN